MRFLKNIFWAIFVLAVSFILTVLVMSSIHNTTFVDEIKSWGFTEQKPDKPEDPKDPIGPNDELKLEDFEILPYGFYGNALRMYNGYETDIVVPSEYSIFKNYQDLVFFNNEQIVDYFENCNIDYGEITFTNSTGEKVTILEETDLDRLIFPVKFTGYEQVFVKADNRLDIFKVESIDGQAFKSLQSSLERIVIPEGIVSIGDTIFEYCENLSEVILPDTLRSIGFAAFQSCTSLTRVELPVGLEMLPSYLFSRCKNLVNLIIPENILELPSSIFMECENLKYVSLPSSLLKIDEMAFMNCKSLQRLDIPETVTYIGSAAFIGCESLQTLEIPNVGFIYERTFEGCKNLSSINLIEGITGCSYSAFKDCISLEELIFPTSFHQFFISSLEGCDNLQRVLVLRDDVIWLCEEEIPSNVSSTIKFYVPDEIYEDYITRENTSWLLITSQIYRLSSLNQER